MKNVIVTGGTGLTGNALVRYLIKKEIYVTALIRCGSIRKKNLPLESKYLTVVECNLGEYDVADKLIPQKEYDAFFHLAWDGSMGEKKVDNRNNVSLQYSNIGAFIQAVELCAKIGCRRFIATGSQAEYGPLNGIIDEKSLLNPVNAYGIAKNCARNMATILCEQRDIDLIWARLFSIYGPKDGANSLVDVGIKNLISGVSIPYTEGIQDWNYLYSFDAAKALYLLALNGKAGEIYCVASSKTRKLKEYISIMHEIVNKDVLPRFGEIPYVNNQVMNMQVDISKLVKCTGFVEEYSFEQGIREIEQELRNIMQ